MDCVQVQQHIDDYIDGYLEATVQTEVKNHISTCTKCSDNLVSERDLRHALKNMAAPFPSPAFQEQVFARTAGAHFRRQLRRKIYSAGAAIAACLMVWMTITFNHPNLDTNSGNIFNPDMTLTLHQAKTIHLALESSRQLENARVTVELPDNIDLVDYPGQRQLSWTTNIGKGKNLISLPIKAIHAGNIALITRIEHENRHKEHRVNLTVVQHQLTSQQFPEEKSA